MHPQKKMTLFVITPYTITSICNISEVIKSGEYNRLDIKDTLIYSRRVVSLEVSPTDDGFISSSLDNTVRLWDLRTPITRVIFPG